MKNIRKAAAQYLEAFDLGHNEFGIHLSLDEFAASRGWSTSETIAVRTYLENKGVL